MLIVESRAKAEACPQRCDRTFQASGSHPQMGGVAHRQGFQGRKVAAGFGELSHGGPCGCNVRGPQPGDQSALAQAAVAFEPSLPEAIPSLSCRRLREVSSRRNRDCARSLTAAARFLSRSARSRSRARGSDHCCHRGSNKAWVLAPGLSPEVGCRRSQPAGSAAAVGRAQ
jgi:hypothetical protein